MLAVGLDLGSQKTMVVADDGEIVRTDTGSISRPTLVSFAGKKRLFGEEAFAQLSSEQTIALLNLMAGRSIAEATELVSLTGRKVSVVDDNGRIAVDVLVNGNPERYFISSLLAMFISHLGNQINVSTSPDSVYCFALPSQYTLSVERAYREAALIAGIDSSRIFVADAADCLLAAYARKVSGLGGPDKAHLHGKNVMLVDMGCMQTTVVLVQYGIDTDNGPQKLAVRCDYSLGAYHFDLRLFEHFNDICMKKHGSKCEVSSKRGNRLLTGCERMRKLLSQLSESQITVENLTDNGDVHFTLRREDMASLCVDLLNRFRSLIAGVIADAGAGITVDAVEIVGGGVRMPVIQQIILQTLGEEKPLGAKLDDGSVAVGAALLYKKSVSAAPTASMAMDVADSTTEPATEAKNIESAPGDSEWLLVPSTESIPAESTDSSIGFSSTELETLRALELTLQAKDEEVNRLQAAYNRLESYLLEMRNAPRQKFGQTIDSGRLNTVLDEYETWLWDNSETATLVELQAKEIALRTSMSEICEVFFAKTEEERKRVEDALQEEAAKAAMEKAANGEEDEDHDNRKLKKADRMRLVVKNKDEGTELFKGGNFRPAAARYHKALTHAAKFFDLSKEDEEEVRNLKVTLYCNLASCYIKLENWEQVQRTCDDALKLEPRCVKALFRRASYHEQRKDWENALSDYRQCAEINDSEDKLVTKGMDRAKKEIAKMKDKEKKMWGKAFS